MIDVCLHGIKDPVLIFEASTGVKYFNQCGGCSCTHKEVEGFIFPAVLKKEDSKFFDPKLWYQSYGWNSLKVSEFLKQENKNKTFTPTEIVRILSEDSLNWRDIRSWAKYKMFCLEIDELLEPYGVQINPDKQSIEAWVHISSTNFGDGILTWENCD